MIQIWLSAFLLCLALSSLGQKQTEKDFYSHLQNVLQRITNANDSVKITARYNHCFGFSSWTATIKPISNNFQITSYIDKAPLGKGAASVPNLHKGVNTSTIPRQDLLNSLEKQKSLDNNMMIIAGSSQVYLIEHGKTKKEFRLRSALGVYSLLR